LFSGIVEAVGRIQEIEAAPGSTRLRVAAPFSGLSLGESVCVSGVCLTVVVVSIDSFDVEVSAETLRRSRFAALQTGDPVNLERSLRLGDRLSGHLVFGHVDGVGRLASVTLEGDSRLCRFEVPDSIVRYLVEKGSIAVDGVSLTVFQCESGGFSSSIIPHTANVTTLGKLRPSDRVNLESDMIARYVEQLSSPYVK
jgi:riboflavin synthase